ncbi:SDR family NAD(P)-dependent oxidoreductase [Nocardioides daphniae]|uniref:SDR family NAD(P)-dependent oxidoreductase n=1 Tax=Nocardioides daphniae TaxID=402297 RepID=A0A4P7U7X1_9ACTN|nr:SDR family NAD(P)-dependent oxidoreductase [Nocardioides daphniae]QCC76242.1 SDR family NAD(P)-dependent oxidoreductase [Nocardioides daphniae]GGD08708.1 putative short-chain dehydrogenase/reductase [Nocardioides daphniae]
MSSDPTIWHPGTTPDLSGRTYLVTGTSPGGIGQYVARDLAAAGARVVMAARNARRLASAVDLVRGEVPDADLDELLLDLASMEAVRRAAHEAEHFGPLHGLVNNAGVMVSAPQRTADGLDLQMATNHFGPFLLTGMLLPQLAASGDGRVVSVSSQAHRAARTAPTGEPRITEPPKIRMQAYGQSKLANLLFTYELDRRLQQAGLPVKALAAHPGYSATPLFANGRFGRPSGGGASIVDAVHKALAQPAAHGAWPILMATVADLPGSTYCGPSGRGEARGLPKVVRPSDLALDPAAQHELWEVSERTVGLRYPR